jgi:hypothetical protein
VQIPLINGIATPILSMLALLNESTPALRHFLGANRGKNQVFITPGVVLGRIRLYGRLTLTVGTGYQFTVSDAHQQYENNWILSVRTNF